MKNQKRCRNKIEYGAAAEPEADFTLYWMDVAPKGSAKEIWRLCIWPENERTWKAVKKLTKVTRIDVESGLIVPRSNRQAFRIADALGRMGFIPFDGGEM